MFRQLANILMLLEKTFRLKINTNAEKETLKFWVKYNCKVLG